MFITNDIRYVGVNDHQVDLFEGQYRVPGGMAYNSYVILDEKIAIMDTVDKNFTHEWLDNIQAVLNGRKPDYLVVQHMEPDHAANVGNFMKLYPQTTIVSSAKAFNMMTAFFGTDYADRRIVVGEGDSLSLGKHTLAFVAAPMVHWPEVIVTYDVLDKVLFSADGFGKFGALDVEEPWDDEARRYYIGIVGKYGAQVQALLKKAAGLTIHRICPLHGPIWRRDLGLFLDKYQKWSTYTPEKQGVLIAYASVYGHTEQTCQALANALSIQGVRDVRMYDVSKTDVSEILSEAFCRSHLVLASVTYNGEIFPAMEHLIRELRAHGLKNRKVALVENGTWAPVAGRKMTALLEGSGMEILPGTVTVRSQLTRGQLGQIDALAKAIADTLE